MLSPAWKGDPLRDRSLHLQGGHLYLVSVELFNFKSFEGHHVVGPFLPFTGIVGPNGSGKSNILDAISFVLLLKQLSTKHKHMSELVYREEHEGIRNNPREMWVKLNFKKEGESSLMGKQEAFSLKRVLHPTNICEYFFNEEPLIGEEFAMNISKLNLTVQNFCAQQGKLEELCFKDGKGLSVLVDDLSGSSRFKKDYDQIKEKISECDKEIKSGSENLQALRLEKVKMKGLQEYVDQMKECLKEQKEVEQQLALTEILYSEKEIQEAQWQLEEYEKGIEDTVTERQKVLKELKSMEGEIRKMQNQEESMVTQVRSKKEELLSLQMSSMASQKTIEVSKGMVVQKKLMLQRMMEDLQGKEARKAQYEKLIAENQKQLETLELEKQGNEDIKEQEAVRDEYLKIKSAIEVENAQIGRQISLMEQSLGNLVLRRTKIEQQLLQTKTLLARESNSENLSETVKEMKKELKEKEKQQSNLKKTYEQTKERLSQRKENIHKVEKALLEKEFELKEVEHEKAIRSQEAKTNQTLEELKKRCKGYFGQIYELIKPINGQFEIGVKVALSKCLKFMVVDSAASAEYCTEFLKEKGLFKDLLVLENVPEKQINYSLKKAIGNRGNLVYEVVEVSRKHQNLDRAIRYFLGDKVICKDFDTAATLQGQGIKDIVTEDGTEFKAGMISGGHHQNIFNLTLGTFKLDKEWQKILAEVQKMDEELQGLKGQEKEDNSEMEQKRGLAKLESEIEDLKLKVGESEKMIKEANEKSTDLNQQVKALDKDRKDVVVKIEDVLGQKKELQLEIREAEEAQFREFLKQVGFSKLEDYEKHWSEGSAKGLTERKAHCFQLIEKMQRDLKAIEDGQHRENIQALESSLKQEEEKLKSLMSGERNQETVGKLQEELKMLDEEQLVLKKQREDVAKRQTKFRLENESLQNRLESLQKDVSLRKIHIKNWELKKESQIEAAQLSRLILFEEEEKLQESGELVQINSEERRQPGKLNFSKLSLQDPQRAGKEEVSALVEELRERLKELTKKEDEYNQNAGLVPESDPNVNALNDQIIIIKEKVDKVNKERVALSEKLRELGDKRTELFLAFFDDLQRHLKEIYAKVTEKEGNFAGTVQLFIDDRQLPFEKDVHYYPCPPGKRVIYDISQLSGGEKTVAALALLFALAKVKRPPLILLDEVDTFLDSQNVKLMTDYIREELGCQLILISHKETVVKNANCLIGASFVRQLKTSKIFSLNLDTYSD